MGTSTLDNAEVEVLWAMTKAVELLRNYFYRKGVCVIDNAVKTIQKKNNKCGIGNRGKTKIVVKEHFSEKGKTMEELLTDVMLEKQSRQSHKFGAVVRNRLNVKNNPYYTLLASRYCKHGLVIKEDN